MATRDDLCEWVVQAMRASGGQAAIVDVCKHIWEHHEPELRRSGGLFYTWQYDMRWAGQRLREEGALMPAHGSRSGPWRLSARELSR